MPGGNVNSIAQLASERTPLSLFAPAPSTISSVPLTRNLPPAAPFPTPSKALGTKNRLFRYRKDIRCTKNPLLGYATHFQKHSVQKTGFSGTERIFGVRKPLSGVRDAFSEAFGVKNRLFRYGRDIRYRKQASTVRKGYSVHENPLLGYATHFLRRAVQKTGFWGTGEIFGTENALLRYGPPTVRNEATGYDYCGFWLEDAAITNNPAHPNPTNSLNPQKQPCSAKTTQPHKTHQTHKNHLAPTKAP